MPLPTQKLNSTQIRQLDPDDFMVASWNEKNIGQRYGVARRVPSLRRDITKIELVIPDPNDNNRCKNLQLKEEVIVGSSGHRESVLSFGGQDYEFYLPTDLEFATCQRVIREYGRSE